MKITCQKCKHQQSFNVEVSDYQGYVCPQCHSYFVGTNSESWVFNKKFDTNIPFQWATLGETINIDNNNFQIITKIYRKTGLTTSNEYVGLSANDLELYLSDGEDEAEEYACKLKLLDDNPPQKVDDVTYNHNKNKYVYLEKVPQDVLYAEGFVFEDLNKRSFATTYKHSFNEEKFLSEEQFGDHIEYYSGQYLELGKYWPLFSKFRSHSEKKSNFGKFFRKILFALGIVPGLIFYFLNQPYFGKQVITIDESFTTMSDTASFLSKSFTLRGTQNQKLNYDGFSVPNKGNVNLSIRLVNQETNEVLATNQFHHRFNSKDHANAIEIDFCRVKPGTYHLVYEINQNNSDKQPLLMLEQVKLTYGGQSYLPLVIYYLIFLIISYLLWHYFTNLKTNISFLKDETFPLGRVLTSGGFIYFYVLLIAIIIGYHYYDHQLKKCENTIKIDSMVDHTKTGNRMIYFRSYNSGSNHK